VIDLDRVSDPELLRAVAKIQDAEIRRLHAKVSMLTEQLALASGADQAAVQEQLAALARELEQRRATAYENGSERRPRPADAKAKSDKTPQSGHGPKSQPELPVVDVQHDLDPPDRICKSCGGELEEIVGQTEDSEEIDVVDVQYILKKHRKKKYRCKCGGCIETALGPTKLITGGRYSLAFAIHVAIEKYCSHMPLERQVKRMMRAGLSVETQTLWDQLFALSRCFDVAIERLHQHLLSKEVLLADESHWPLLGVSGRPTKNWFDWALVSEDAVLHSILESRSNEAADVVLRDFKGVLLTDAYGVYASRAKANGFTLAHDWTHARRYVLQAEATAPAEATSILDDIGKLFLIEREIVEAFTGLPREDALAVRARIRAERSRPIVQRIGQRAYEVRALRDSPIAKAVTYLENQWSGLIRFLDDPRIPITSNAAESALRCAVLGRNNHYGSKSKRGTEVAAKFYSLIESAKLNDLDPAKYMRCAAEAHLRGNTVPLPHELRLAGLATLAAAPPIPAVVAPAPA
jgi:transposase